MATLDRNAQVHIIPYVEPVIDEDEYDPNSGRPTNLETSGLPVRVTLGELIDFIAEELDESEEGGGGGNEGG